MRINEISIFWRRTELVVREKCNSLKHLKSSFKVTNTDDFSSKIINYENSIIGKRLLSASLIITNPDPIPNNLVASDSELN